MGIQRIDSLPDSQVDDLLSLYRQAWWAKDRTAKDARQMLNGASFIVGYRDDESGALVAFARVLTDGIYKAFVFDVIVDEARRDQGLGVRLIDDVVGHPRLASVRHIELYCLAELEPFYERWGFTSDLGRLRFMRREHAKVSH